MTTRTVKPNSTDVHYRYNCQNKSRRRWIALVCSLIICLVIAVLSHLVIAVDYPKGTEQPTTVTALTFPSPHEALTTLRWMLGNWQLKYETFTINRSIQYSTSGNYLLIRDTARDQNEELLYREWTIIAYNPVSELFETWVFRDSGGFGGGVMELFGNQWLVPVRMILADGRTSTCNNIYTPLDEGGFTWQSTSRTLDGLALPDLPATVARRVTPPEKKEKEKEDEAASFVL